MNEAESRVQDIGVSMDCGGQTWVVPDPCWGCLCKLLFTWGLCSSGSRNLIPALMTYFNFFSSFQYDSCSLEREWLPKTGWKGLSVPYRVNAWEIRVNVHSLMLHFRHLEWVSLLSSVRPPHHHPLQTLLIDCSILSKQTSRHPDLQL